MNYREKLEKVADVIGIADGWQHIFEDWDGPTCEDYDWNPLERLEDAMDIAFQQGYYVTFPVKRNPVAVVHKDITGEVTEVQARGITRHDFAKAVCEAVVQCLLNGS